MGTQVMGTTSVTPAKAGAATFLNTPTANFAPAPAFAGVTTA